MAIPHEGIAIVAGAGAVPIEIALAARRSGRDVLIIAIRGSAEPEAYDVFPTIVLRIGQLGAMLSALEKRGIRHVAMAGGLVRPALSDLRPDAGMLRRLPKIVQAFRGGDDHLLRKVIAIFEECGLTVKDLREIAPDLIAGEGAITKRRPTEQTLSDGKLGLSVLDSLAPYDVGQATVVVDGRVVAIEGAEGTDGLLERIASMRAAGRLRDRKGKGILVKAAKRGQDMRVDLPAVGPVTVAGCVRAGLAGIVVRAGEVLLTERARLREDADREGLFIAGIVWNGKT